VFHWAGKFCNDFTWSACSSVVVLCSISDFRSLKFLFFFHVVICKFLYGGRIIICERCYWRWLHSSGINRWLLKPKSVGFDTMMKCVDSTWLVASVDSLLEHSFVNSDLTLVSTDTVRTWYFWFVDGFTGDVCELWLGLFVTFCETLCYLILICVIFSAENNFSCFWIDCSIGY